MKPVFLTAAGILGPGLDGWERACAILQRREPYAKTAVATPVPAILAVRDRRRCSELVSMALHVAQQTLQMARLEPGKTPAVFANSAGDGEVMHRLLTALAKPDKPVSPTDFHNSVHNAPAFYWSLGAASREASTSIAAGRYTFAAALLKAAVQCVAGDTPVLMVCFDNPLPPPLNDTYPMPAPLTIGLALSPRLTADGLAEIELSWSADADRKPPTPPRIAELADLWSGNPAGRALPLLEALANRDPVALSIPVAADATLEVRLTCH